MWIFSSGNISADIIDVEEITIGILKHFKGYSNILKRQREKHELTLILQVVLFVSTNDEISTLSLGFSTKTIKFLNEIGTAIDIDLYRN